MGGPGTVFVEDRVTEFTYQSRLYLDGRNLFPPKPVVVNELNPRHIGSEKPNTNNADLDFEHVLLNNMVWGCEGSKSAVSRENLSSGFSTRSITNLAVQPQKMARGLKFLI